MLYQAKRLKVDIVINGGDMLPKGPGSLHKAQESFLKWLYEDHLSYYNEEKIHYCCMLGNDDLEIFDQVLMNMEEELEYIHDITMTGISIKDVHVVGCNWVKDYPFLLKDRCLLDSAKETTKDACTLEGLLSTFEGYRKLSDWGRRVNSMPRLDETLRAMPKKVKELMDIVVIHMPPSSCRLDVCMNTQQVGSDAVLGYIKERKPEFSLHGHIHENHHMTGIWETSIKHSDNEGDYTSVIQPGQSLSGKELIYVYIDTETRECHRQGVCL